MEIKDLYNIFINECSQSISTDTRKIKTGSLFFAWKGENIDGNKFAEEALEKGANYVVIDNPEYKVNEKCILVQDSIKTLQDLASFHRNKFNIPLIVIGGSNGKTTTKELLVSVLEKKYKTHYTKESFNNHTGVPLTILDMHIDSEIAVIEIGANHIGEHKDLLAIVKPCFVLVTNNGKDHLEGFGSIQGVREANKEIYDWAKENNAKIFVNKFISDLMQDSDGGDCILYPQKEYESTSGEYASLIYGKDVFESKLFGSYNEPNILASIAIGEYFEIDISSIQKSILEYSPSLKRSQIIKTEDNLIILDCYNANPSSMELSLKDLFLNFKDKNKIIIVGDMLELGESSSQYHLEILDYIKYNISKEDIVLAVGKDFYQYKNIFDFNFFENVDSAKILFDSLNKKDALIFVKASRGIRLENIF